MTEIKKINQTTLSILSWNIETPNYCNEIKHPHNYVQYLDNDYRFKEIKEKITNLIKKDVIICLQELCRDWSCKFELIFKKNNYTMIKSLYGYEKNGYMGVCIAFPNFYNLLDCKIERVSTISKLPDKNDNTKGYIESLLDYFGFNKDKEMDVMDIVKSRSNTVIALKLQNNNTTRPFWLLNFHMPCLWRQPKVMEIYSILLQRFIKSITNNGSDPCIFLGDFNSKPTSNQYEIFINGLENIDKKSFLNEYPNFIKCEKFIKFRSAYKEIHNDEPICTNYSYCDFSGDFKGTIDYIFISNNIKVDNMEKLLDPETYLPNNNCPSDHLPLFAKLVID